MKLKLRSLFAVFCLTSLHSFSQQNLFNVPSSEITLKNKFFFQQQFNVGNVLQSNTNICYGLEHEFEIGINLIGLVYNYQSILTNETLGEGPISPSSMFTIQKLFKVSKNTHLGIGAEIGSNFFVRHSKNMFFTNFIYFNSNNSFLNERLHLIAGIYYANKAYQGADNGLGVMTGCDFKLSNKIHLVGDWISGNNYIGLGVLGGQYFVHPQIPLSLGIQIPNNTQKNSYGLVFEFTYLPKT